MTSSTKLPEIEQPESKEEDWIPVAWVYFLWVVLDRHVYCKIGYSKCPSSRLNQLMAGIPEEPFRIHLLPCLSVVQAKLFEGMFHDYLRKYQTRGGWFTHPNVRHWTKALQFKLREILTLFNTFGYFAIT